MDPTETPVTAPVDGKVMDWDDDDDMCDSPAMHAAGLYFDMTAAWHALTLAEWKKRPDSELLAHYDAYLTALGAYIKYRREYQDREGQHEAKRRQRANFNAVADGMAPPHPSEY